MVCLEEKVLWKKTANPLLTDMMSYAFKCILKNYIQRRIDIRYSARPLYKTIIPIFSRVQHACQSTVHLHGL